MRATSRPHVSVENDGRDMGARKGGDVGAGLGGREGRASRGGDPCFLVPGRGDSLGTLCLFSGGLTGGRRQSWPELAGRRFSVFYHCILLVFKENTGGTNTTNFPKHRWHKLPISPQSAVPREHECVSKLEETRCNVAKGFACF